MGGTKGRSGDEIGEREATINGLDCCGFERKNNHFAGWLIEMGEEEGEREPMGSILCPDLC